MIEIDKLIQKRNELIKQFDKMAKEHKKLYSCIDISEPKSNAEKASEKAKAEVIAKANAINKQIRELKNIAIPPPSKKDYYAVGGGTDKKNYKTTN